MQDESTKNGPAVFSAKAWARCAMDPVYASVRLDSVTGQSYPARRVDGSVPQEEPMRRVGVVVSFALWVALPLGAQRPEAKNDEAAVREVVRLYVEAREARDAGAIAALFTEDADQLTSGGEW